VVVNGLVNEQIRAVAIILAKNEENRVGDAIRRLAPFFDRIICGVDMSTSDRTIMKVIDAGADVVMTSVDIEGFGAVRTRLDTLAADCQVHLHADCDEIFDVSLLADIRDIGMYKYAAYRMTRCNLPDGKDYPDWQVRLFQYNTTTRWEGKLHEVLWSINKNCRLDQAGIEFGTYNSPIIHLPREGPNKRTWW
jgi:hypothetical protein